MSLARVLAHSPELGFSQVPPALLPPGFYAWPEDHSPALVRLAFQAVKGFERVERGKVEQVRPFQREGMGWPHPPEVSGHKVLGVYTHPATPHAIYDLGHGLHAEAQPPGRKPGGVFRPGKPLRSATGLDQKALTQKGWSLAKPPPPPPAAKVTTTTAKGGKGLPDQKFVHRQVPGGLAARTPAEKRWLADRQNWKTRPGKGGALAKVAGKGGALAKVAGKGSPRSALPWSKRPGGVVEYHNSRGIDRAKMPQLSGKLADGSYVPSAKMQPQFIKALQERGVKVDRDRVPSWSLRPTQATGDMPAIRGIADALKSGDMADTKPIVVSSDNHVVDGHHNWAGRVLADAEGGHPGLPPGMPVVRVGLPIDKVLAEAHKFAAAKGIQGRATGEHHNPDFDTPARAAATRAAAAARAATKAKQGAVTPAKGATKTPKVATKTVKGATKPGKAAGSKAYKPLSDAEYGHYRQRLEDSIAKASTEHKGTEFTHTVGGDGKSWTPERHAVHDELIKEFLDKYKDVPAEGKAKIAGGLGGAGKSSVLAKDPDVRDGKYAIVNPDNFKEALAKRGLVPPLPGMPEATPMERTSLVHEESSYLAKRLAAALQAQHKNMIWDITMSSPGGVESRMAALRANGYSHVHGLFVHIPVEKSVDSIASRHRAGLEAYRQGKSELGERFVPSTVVRAAATRDGSNANRKTFDALRPKFDSWDLWDRSDMKEAKRVGQGGTRNGTERR